MITQEQIQDLRRLVKEIQKVLETDTSERKQRRLLAPVVSRQHYLILLKILLYRP